MDNAKPNLQATADAAVQAETEGQAAAELGKFKDVRALLDAYNSLEAEFTRRSQRLRELENASKATVAAEHAATAGEPSQGQKLDGAQLLDAARKSEEVKNAIISDYLSHASKNRSVPFVTGGITIAAGRQTPATLKEAGELAEKFLNKRED